MDSEIAKRQSLESHDVSNSYKTQAVTATLESVRRVRVVAEGFEAARHLFNRPVGVCISLKNTCAWKLKNPAQVPAKKCFGRRKTLRNPPHHPHLGFAAFGPLA